MINGDIESLDEDELSLLEMLDHVLDRGLVIAGEITISVADVDLIFVGLNVLLGSIETIERTLGQRERAQQKLTRGARPSIRGDIESHGP
jgi:hypothetical protein